jgi:hypothetical protein
MQGSIHLGSWRDDEFDAHIKNNAKLRSYSYLAKDGHHRKCRVYVSATRNAIQKRPTGYPTRALISVNCSTATKMALALYVHHEIAPTANEYPMKPSSEITTPMALINTRGNKQYPRTLAVRRKFMPMSDMRLRIKWRVIVPSRMNPYTYPKWLFPA